jgi:hypothetical protein
MRELIRHYDKTPFKFDGTIEQVNVKYIPQPARRH